MATSVSRRLIFVLVPVAALVALVVFWQWDWFIPLVQARASAKIGRSVTIAHLHVSLGRITQVVADDVRVANPDGFAGSTPFASIAHLGVSADLMATLSQGRAVLPGIDVDTLAVLATQDASGANNYMVTLAPSAGPDPDIGSVTITNGQAHVVLADPKADVTASIVTRTDPASGLAQIVVDAKGSYAGQPIAAKLTGGALLSLRNQSIPYPIDLQIANGPTRVNLVGSVLNPVAFAGADLKLSFAGPNMGLLFPLTGIPLPKTPPYKLTGQLDYADGKIKFHGLSGTIGASDFEGDIDIDPTTVRKDVVATLHSRSVDLEDLGGFIGSEPGRSTDPNMSTEQKRDVAKAEASPQLIPNTPINLPNLRSADIHLRYRGDHIKGRSVPFDRIEVAMDMVDGAISLHPITLGVGTGQIVAQIALSPAANDQVHAKAEVQVQRLDVSKLMAATHTVDGAGRLGGTASIDTSGTSLAGMLGAGNGKLDLYMSGGNLSALLIDLSGLEFGNALLSALGIPTQADLRCLIGQFDLRQGVLQTRTLLIDTSEAVVSGKGDIDLAHEQLNIQIITNAKHLSIGSLKAPIEITGKFKNMHIAPNLLALGLRGGVAAGLGFVFPPLALLPTIQLGVGDDNRCEALLAHK